MEIQNVLASLQGELARLTMTIKHLEQKLELLDKGITKRLDLHSEHIMKILDRVEATS